MAYTYKRMKKLEFEEVEELHCKGELAGCYLLFDDDTEAQIESDYRWDDIVSMWVNGVDIGYEI